MAVNGVTTTTYQNSETKRNRNTVSDQKKEQELYTEPAATYEKNSEPKKVTYKQDTATLEQLKSDAERRTSQLRDLVEKMMLSQGKTFNESEMYSYLRSDDLKADPEIIKQAQGDIAENGYWGVNQTSDRLVSFAKALTGGDPDKIDEMISAIQEGFNQATKAWGGDLPDISKKTLDATMEKLEKWRSEATNSSVN
ncbi:MAG: hypothetical protein K0S61_2791 [Anaerocolumna sp.]|jgi:hypothetical protein|nr:hypothetical protein [Anaerocolumna sp.]